MDESFGERRLLYIVGDSLVAAIPEAESFPGETLERVAKNPDLFLPTLANATTLALVFGTNDGGPFTLDALTHLRMIKSYLPFMTDWCWVPPRRFDLRQLEELEQDFPVVAFFQDADDDELETWIDPRDGLHLSAAGSVALADCLREFASRPAEAKFADLLVNLLGSRASDVCLSYVSAG